MDQRRAFNDVAALYDKGRPNYPQALFDEVCTLAELTPGMQCSM